MKKLFFFIVLVIGGTLIFAGTNNTATGTATPPAPKDSTIAAKIVMTKLPASKAYPKKGEILITADSIALFRNSDSLLYVAADNSGLLPFDAKPQGKKR